MSFVELFQVYRHAWIAALLIAVACSIVGVYVVLRRVSFVGIAMAQVAAAGVSLGLLLHLSPLWVASIATLVGVSFFAYDRQPVRVSGDGVVGAVYAAASALAILFVFRSSAELDRIEHIVYGTLLFTTADQVTYLTFGVAVIVLIHALFAREFVMVSFDGESARTLGVRTQAFHLLLFATIGAAMVLSIGAAGSLLAFALLVLPPMTALLLSDRLPAVFLLSLVSGLLAALVGVYASIVFDVPTSAAIVIAAVLILLVSASTRISPALGVLLAVALCGGLVAVGQRDDEAASHASLNSGEPPHVDLELALHDRTVRVGEVLAVDYVLRVRGAVPAELHLLVNVGPALAAVRVTSVRRAGRTEVQTGELAPGRYVVSASLWTGPPLEPTVDTTMLPPDVCSALELEIEVRE